VGGDSGFMFASINSNVPGKIAFGGRYYVDGGSFHNIRDFYRYLGSVGKINEFCYLVPEYSTYRIFSNLIRTSFFATLYCSYGTYAGSYHLAKILL
jgi:hypothetical protein